MFQYTKDNDLCKVSDLEQIIVTGFDENGYKYHQG